MNNNSWDNLEKEFLYYASLISKEQEVMDALKLVTAGKAALDGIKLLNQYAKEIKDTTKRGEFMRIIRHLSIELAETQIRLAEQIEKEAEYKKQIKQLKDEIENLYNANNDVVLKNGVYYKKNKEYPLCTGCFDNNRKLILLNQMSASFRSIASHTCPVCKAKYNIK